MRFGRVMRSALCLALALAIAGQGVAFAESEGNGMQQLPAQEEHFVPENPDMTRADEQTVQLDLTNRLSVEKQSRGTVGDDRSLRMDGGVTNKVAIPMPFEMLQGQRIRVTVSGRFDSDQDKSLRLYLTNSSSENCSSATVREIMNTQQGAFEETVELIAGKPADMLMLATSGTLARFQDVTILSVAITCSQAMLDGMDASVPYSEAVRQDWYSVMLKRSQLRLGNNRRLKAVTDRAKAGEKITIATIGGSITEGAGAKRYQECYAYRIYEGFREAYGREDGSNVAFVNAGVGGTPSTFGWMRYQRDIVDRVQDSDGLPDIVVIEYSVNDGGEPTNHQCFESMVRQVLSQPNEPVVILLFAVFQSGYNLQSELKKIGETYDLMMVSIKDGPFREVGSKWTEKGFFYDEYHPTTLGHAVMADCVLQSMADALAQPVAEQDIDLTAAPAYGDSFVGIRTIYKHGDNTDLALECGGFSLDDTGSYTNRPVGRVCGENFHHGRASGNEPLTFTASFKNLMIAYRTMNDASYGRAVVYIDGKPVRTLIGNTGSWGQSVVDLLYSANEATEHTVSIRMADGDEDKKFTITCMSYTP
ncbi:MAG: SGNH/GDSL hydrolase family protein [bacterium]|nr:SGNH/GDSL hydrolase family protein [bacterium]